MTDQSSANKWAGLGVLSAVAASLCCIVPALAFIAGVSGLAAAVSWLEPVRPYLMVLSIAVLGFAWYRKLKPQPATCTCGASNKTPFLQSKTFLAVVTAFALLMMTFPWYADAFYPHTPQKKVVVVQASDVQTATFDVSGMTCPACETPIHHAVAPLPGVLDVTAVYEEGKAAVRFDRSKVNAETIRKAISQTGYQVTAMRLADAARK